MADIVTSAGLSAQNRAHLLTLKTVLTDVDKTYPGLPSDPRKTWNWDEMAILCEYGTTMRCYASASHIHGGARRSVRDSGKHVTSGIAIASCGNIAPLLLRAESENGCLALSA